jgi:hypothetical protein
VLDVRQGLLNVREPNKARTVACELHIGSPELLGVCRSLAPPLIP